MTHQQFVFYQFAMIVMCAVMSIVNVLKNGHRGKAAYFLSAAFLVFGVAIYLYYSQAPGWLLDVTIAVLLLLLCADFFFRVGKPPQKGKRR